MCTSSSCKGCRPCGPGQPGWGTSVWPWLRLLWKQLPVRQSCNKPFLGYPLCTLCPWSVTFTLKYLFWTALKTDLLTENECSGAFMVLQWEVSLPHLSLEHSTPTRPSPLINRLVDRLHASNPLVFSSISTFLSWKFSLLLGMWVEQKTCLCLLWFLHIIPTGKRKSLSH